LGIHTRSGSKSLHKYKWTKNWHVYEKQIIVTLTLFAKHSFSRFLTFVLEVNLTFLTLPKTEKNYSTTKIDFYTTMQVQLSAMIEISFSNVLILIFSNH